MFLVDYLFNSSDPTTTELLEETFEMVVNPDNVETRSIAIHHAMNGESQLFRLQRGNRLRIVPGSSLLGRRVALYCNMPVNGTCGVYNFKFKDELFQTCTLQTKETLYVSNT